MLLGAARVQAQAPVPDPPLAVRFDSAFAQVRRLDKSNPTEVLRQGQRVLTLARQLNDPRRQAQCSAFLATAALYAGEAKQALDYNQQALALARQCGDSLTAALACRGVAATLADRHDVASAGSYLQQGLRLAPAGPRGYELRGAMLSGLAAIDFNAGRFRPALAQALQASELFRQAAHPRPILVSSNDGLLAACYSSLNDEPRARRIIAQTLARDRRAGDFALVVANLTTLGKSLLKDQPSAGLDTLRAALALARRHGLRTAVLDCYQGYFDYYIRVGRYRDASAWQERHRLLNDSLDEQQQQQALMAFNSKYEARARDQQIVTLNQRGRIAALERGQQLSRNRLLLALVVALGLGLTGAATFVWKLKRRDQLLARHYQALTEATAAAHAHAAARDRLYALVAHDLRGPVASFGAVSQLIELYLQQKDGAGLQQVTALVRQTARNLSELLHNLLGWTLSQTGELTYTPEHLLLAPLLTEIRHLYASTAQSRQVRFELLAPPDLHVWADVQMVQTILRNLVGNALKFVPEGGQLRVSAAPNQGPGGPTVCLAVADNGSGMSADQIRRLLGTGADAAPPRPLAHDPRAGTGLGLSLCLAFVRRQGGTLSIESTPGVGTTVRVFLPVEAPVQTSEPVAA